MKNARQIAQCLSLVLFFAGCATGSSARAYHPLSELLCEAVAEKNFDARIAKLQSIAVDHPHSPVAHFLIGQLLEKEGRIHDALRSYERAVEIQPSCVPCRSAVGQVLIQHASSLQKNEVQRAKEFDTRGES